MMKRYPRNIVCKRLCSLLLPLGLLSAGAAQAAVLKADFNGDGLEDLAVGVPFNDINGHVNAGSIDVFYGRAGGPTTTPNQILHQDTPGSGGAPGIADKAETGEQFGRALAVGDFNHDGYDDLAVGVPFESVDGVGNKAGVVNIIYGSSSGLWLRDNHILHTGEYRQAYSYFGESLTVGDFDGDGYDDLAVGASGWNLPNITDAGMAMVFFGATNGLIESSTSRYLFLHQNQRRVPGGAEPYDQLGKALTAADFDHDGYDDLAIGIHYEDIGNTVDAGGVAVLYGGSNDNLFDISRPHFLMDQFVEADDRFGEKLTTGDFNGDRYQDLAIGHPYEDASAKNSGAVSIVYGGRFGASGGVRQYWPVDVYNLPGKPEIGDFFGWSLAAADFDLDGYDDLAIGSPHEDQERRFRRDRRDTGRVTVLSGSSTGLYVGPRSDWHQDKSGVPSSRREFEHFGDALSVGDFNQDAYADLVVGVPGEYDDDVGMAHILYGTIDGLSADWRLGTQILNEGSAAKPKDWFGSALP